MLTRQNDGSASIFALPSVPTRRSLSDSPTRSTSWPARPLDYTVAATVTTESELDDDGPARWYDDEHRDEVRRREGLASSRCKRWIGIGGYL